MMSAPREAVPEQVPARPIPDSYWVIPGRFLAGEHPGSASRAVAMDRLKRFLATGVSCFIDLTDPDEAPAYEAYLPFATPDGRRVTYLREPIPDHDVPTGREAMTRILRMIDDALAAGHVVYLHCRAGVGRSSAVMDVDSQGRYRVHVGVTDVGGGAKTTMGLIAAEALGVPLSQVEVIWGDTSRCPYSVGESGSRTTIMTGYAVVEAANDIKRQVAEKGLPKGADLLTATANTNPSVAGGKVRNSYGAHFVEVEVDTAVGHVRISKYLAVHDSGRIMNPLSAIGQIKGAAQMGIGMALHEELLYDPRSGQALTPGFYGHRVSTHMDAPEIEVMFIESDDGYGPFGAKSIGEAGKIPAVAAVANAIFNATGRRMKDLPISRDKLVGGIA